MAEEVIYKGIAASPGISISKAYHYAKNQVVIDDAQLDEEEITQELEDFDESIRISLKELNKIYELSRERIGDETSRIFDAQMEILNDDFFINMVKEKIKEGRRTAGYIFSKEIGKLTNALSNSDDDYMRDRVTDINDVRNRVIRNMKRGKLVSKVEENSIIVAHELTPADTILFSRRKVQGYVTDIGGVTGHAALIARALRVPAVVGTKVASYRVLTGELVIVDGFSGLFITGPTDETIEKYKAKLEEIKEYEKKLYEVFDFPCETKDKKHIELSANIEFDEEIDFVTKFGHCSIGLYRTEHLFLEAGDFPSEKYQIEEYSHIANVTYPNTVTIRTYDIGGDKLLPSSQKEANPFLGWRGIRICLDRVTVFKEQLRAMLIASRQRNLKIMFPMISSLDEVRRAKEILEEVKAELDGQGVTYDKNIPVGIMVEVPSTYFIAEELAKEVDFFSIGTNDLIQYLLAVDRGNELIADMFQQFHPAVVKTIKKIIDTGHRNEIPVSICGEMASNPIAAVLLIGLGADELSVVPSVFPEIKSIIRCLTYDDVKDLAGEILTYNTEKEVRDKITAFYEENVGVRFARPSSE
ncbi:MAG: phosphoenolpyruvate--protein phosphotransferase [Ignavibacteriae bacterium]|nr:phosphoenolpyruvate--protein phosphotransferase [Ignavibacteriota bacterium]